MSGEGFSVVYCTNIWNHYQASWLRTFHARLGSHRFQVLLLESIPDERRKLGWDDVPPSLDWVWPAPRTRLEYGMRRQRIIDADSAILGACPKDIRLARAGSGKLIFITAGRSLRRPVTWLRRANPVFRSHLSSLRRTSNRPNVHFLAIGKFAPEDSAR
jgi:hypothetical protein